MDVSATLKQSYDDLVNPGDFIFTTARDYEGHAGMIFLCPCGCKSPRSVVFRGAPNRDGRPSWQWNGNEDKPSLRPSLLATTGCRWHGFLTDGVFSPC